MAAGPRYGKDVGSDTNNLFQHVDMAASPRYRKARFGGKERLRWAQRASEVSNILVDVCVTMIATNKRLDRLALKLLRGQSSSSFLIEKITDNRFNMVNIV